MEEIECIVCFSQYDGEEHRPRSLPCGHGICTECLGTAIRDSSGKCPKCRTLYSANKVEDIPVNYPLESVIKLLSISKNNTSNDSHECLEHLLPLSHRCSTHKAWICQICVKEDHSSYSCTVITVAEEIDNKRSKQINLSNTIVEVFEKKCKTVEECKQKYENEIEAHDIIIKRFQEEIKRKEKSKQQILDNYDLFQKKTNDLKGKRSVYDQATATLKSSDTIREVSQCSIQVQKEAEKLRLISHEIEKEVELMQQSFKVKDDQLFSYPKMSVRNGKAHLHVIQENNMYRYSGNDKQYLTETQPPQTAGLLTFLDIAWPDQEPRRVYMKMLGNTARARQHLLLVIGHRGHSYRGLTFIAHNNKDQPGEYFIIGAYDGKKGAPMLPDITLNDNANRNVKQGLMASAHWEDRNENNALFGIYLKDNIGVKDETIFGQVTIGLDILQDIAKSKEKENIKIVDCGVALSW